MRHTDDADVSANAGDTIETAPGAFSASRTCTVALEGASENSEVNIRHRGAFGLSVMLETLGGPVHDLTLRSAPAGSVCAVQYRFRGGAWVRTNVERAS